MWGQGQAYINSKFHVAWVADWNSQETQHLPLQTYCSSSLLQCLQLQIEFPVSIESLKFVAYDLMSSEEHSLELVPLIEGV